MSGPHAGLANPGRRSRHGLVLTTFERKHAVVLRLVVELELALLAAEVVRGALVPDHPVRVVRVHRLLAHRIDRHGPLFFFKQKTAYDMNASYPRSWVPEDRNPSDSKNR